VFGGAIVLEWRGDMIIWCYDEIFSKVQAGKCSCVQGAVVCKQAWMKNRKNDDVEELTKHGRPFLI
jgi:hypothetical protein